MKTSPAIVALREQLRVYKSNQAIAERNLRRIDAEWNKHEANLSEAARGIVDCELAITALSYGGEEVIVNEES